MVQKWPHRRVGLHDCFSGDSGLADLRQAAISAMVGSVT